MMYVGMMGFYRAQTINKFSGKVTRDTGFFPNTILNAGKNIMSERADWMDYCQVGTDGTIYADLADRQNETGLRSYHAGTSTIVAGMTTYGASGTGTVEDPYYGWKRKTFWFIAGTVATTLAEVGVGWWTSGSYLISRAQILSPLEQTYTPVTPLEDELLDITYELRYYIPAGDILGPQVTLNGIVYNTLTRAARVTDAYWGQHIGERMGQFSEVNADWLAFDGAIGTLLTDPNGISAECNNSDAYNTAYSNNSYHIRMNILCGGAGWVLDNGIRCIRISTTAGYYQTQFTAVGTADSIPKTTEHQMYMQWALHWAEKA